MWGREAGREVEGEAWRPGLGPPQPPPLAASAASSGGGGRGRKLSDLGRPLLGQATGFRSQDGTSGPASLAKVFNIRLDTGISQLDNRIFYFQGKNVEINTDV